jgi:hypothetical protein
MAQLWASIIVISLVAVIAALVVWRWQHRLGTALLGAGIGVACGLAGAIFVVRQRLDVVPDDVEALIIAILISVVSIALIIATWLHWFRR